jgi:beta-galactosidase/beta-glucuronidase
LPDLRRTRTRFALLCAPLAALAAWSAPPAAAATPSPGALYTNGPSGRFTLDGEWYRRADRPNRGVARGWHTSRSLRGWSTTTIPNAANAGDETARSYMGGVWWYRKDFEAPGGAATDWVLRFESVNYRATVWLNGRRIGSHTGGYLPFEVPGRGLRRTGTNRLVVRVDSRRDESAVPPIGRRRDGRFVGGWWNYAGILREVYLRRVDTLDLVNVNVSPRRSCETCPARVYVRAVAANLQGIPVAASLSATVGGKDVTFRPATVSGRGFHLFRGSAVIENPRLWSPSDPHLYTVKLVLRHGGRVVQRYTQRTGVRTLQVDDQGRMLLNGHHLALRGASMHEEDPTRGAALGAADITANFDLLRDLGATMTRSHYPLHPLALELADRRGIVVWSEVPVYQMRDALFRRASVRRDALDMVREMVNRDRSHPSVAVWSLGNENTSKPGVGFTRYVREAARITRRLDPTRLVGLAFPGYPTVGKQDLYTSLDALGVNDYFGWYPGPQSSIQDRTALSPYLDRLHDDYQQQALFVTEFGAEANRAGPATEKGTFDFQAQFLDYHLGVFAQKPYLNGALVWILRDFRVKPGYDGGNPQPQSPYNQKGLVDAQGTRKPSFETVKRLFRREAGLP